MRGRYRRFYWDAVLGAELPDGVDCAVFDFAVNSGPGRAAKYLQAVLGVAQDGRVGPATVAAARA
ncbi:glycosyl hydrolase 108 family protein, partial [Mesorhizobium silamurunense]